ncbi:MAG: bifunctional demethylmenaquinone methyltransferase/2-methoxy-6-polyprenyl-1,4-benzoquinol methylase UbiE [Cyanobacteria bacterium SZAS-4]|nr:bifunctional demethylmenaquinone methyltransferase/2-methoxy-6-polyprenyl-1,4-benzoquinol methylase UbiE [Cyanobacteria bacterium SZAS-4]
MSFSLPTAEEKAEYVLRQFDRIAQKYDLTNDAISMGMHHAWKKRAVSELGLKPDGTYLDVCCGTGDLTLRIAKNLSKNGKVFGLDFSPKMLAVAHQRLARHASETAAEITFKEGDALQLPFANGTFDGAIVSFGLRNVTDYQRGINEMTRVVKPGGKVINLDLGKSTVPLFCQLFAFYFRQIVPLIGHALQSDKQAYTYLPVSNSAYPNPQGISEIFKTAGLNDVKHISLALGSVALHVGTVSHAGSSVDRSSSDKSSGDKI